MPSVDQATHKSPASQASTRAIRRSTSEEPLRSPLADALNERQQVEGQHRLQRNLNESTMQRAPLTVQRNGDKATARNYKGLIRHTLEHHGDLLDEQEDLKFIDKYLEQLTPAQIIEIWEEKGVEPFIQEALGVEQELVDSATQLQVSTPLIFAASRAAGLTPQDLSDERQRKKLNGPLELFKRVQSVLSKGILTPQQLRQSNTSFTPSSDQSDQGNVSYFNIDYERNQDDHYDERFPNPGQQAIGPVLERREDIVKLARGTVVAAEKGNEAAIQNITNYQKAIDNTQPLETFLAGVKKDFGTHAVGIGEQARFSALGMAGLEKRAAASAMFVSTGEALQSSQLVKKKWIHQYAPRVDELRAPLGLEPQAITHVILPESLRPFEPFLRGGPEVFFTGNTRLQAGYYDEQSRVRQSVELTAPDYQTVLDQIRASGHEKMLAHISNV